jgi:glucose dehydrogenase
MRKPGLVVLGVVIALAGLLFTLQGTGVVTGSTMSNTTFWSVAGPVIIVVGLVLAVVGARGRRH